MVDPARPAPPAPIGHTGLSRESAVGFIGAGRLGSSLAVAMARSGYRVVAVSSRRASHRKWLSDRLAEAKVVAEPQEVADAAEVIFITTSDGAISLVSDSVTWRTGQAVLHCSGAASLDLLNSPALAGAATGGIHPMQTFPAPDAGVTFGIESESPWLQTWLEALAKALGGRPIQITAEQRPAYHAAAVMACGLLAGLTGLAAEVWASSGGVSRAEAISSLAPLVKTTANSIQEKGLPEALTGPYVRGDLTTVRAHIEASSAVSAEHGAAYAALALAALHLAREQGALSADAEAGIREMLKSALLARCETIERA
ncbi:MAG: DUF2520 domain-containing protein [Chloroflexi bacterium]|nr:DUF2520 domain-containing protein [Chloroflexota bacterium]